MMSVLLEYVYLVKHFYYVGNMSNAFSNLACYSQNYAGMRGL